MSWAWEGEHAGGVEARLSGKTLRKRRNAGAGLVEFHALDAMHREKDDTGRKWIAIFDHGNQIVEGIEFGAREAESLQAKRQKSAPKLRARIAQGDDYQGASPEGIFRRRSRGLTGDLHHSDCRLDANVWQLAAGVERDCVSRRAGDGRSSVAALLQAGDSRPSRT